MFKTCLHKVWLFSGGYNRCLKGVQKENFVLSIHLRRCLHMFIHVSGGRSRAAGGENVFEERRKLGMFVSGSKFF